MGIVGKVIEIAKLVNLPNAYMTLFFISVVVLIVLDRKKTSLNKAVLFPTVGVLLCIVNPVLIGILDKLVGMSARYVRIYWLLPVVIVMAASAVKAGDLAADREKAWGIYGIIGLLVILSGTCLLTRDNFEQSDNLYKLPQEAIDICSMLPEDTRSIRLAVPPSLSSYIRQYDGNIKLLHGRKKEEARKEVYDLMNQEKQDIPYITKYSRVYNCDYIVLEMNKEWTGEVSCWGYRKIGETGNYALYKDIWNDDEGMEEKGFNENGGITDGEIYVLQADRSLMIYNRSWEKEWILVQEITLDCDGRIEYNEEQASFYYVDVEGNTIHQYLNENGLLFEL